MTSFEYGSRSCLFQQWHYYYFASPGFRPPSLSITRPSNIDQCFIHYHQNYYNSRFFLSTASITHFHHVHHPFFRIPHRNTMGKKEVEKQRKAHRRREAKHQSPDRNQVPPPKPQQEPLPDRTQLISATGRLWLLPQLLSTVCLSFEYFQRHYEVSTEEPSHRDALHFAIQAQTDECLAQLLLIAIILHVFAYLRIGGHVPLPRKLEQPGPRLTLALELCMVLLLFGAFGVTRPKRDDPEYIEKFREILGIIISFQCRSLYRLC